MSNEFYNYVARTIVSYFEKIKDDEIIKPGDRYILKLDDKDMVDSVDKELCSLTEKKAIQGKYNYKTVYDTYTIQLSQIEIIVAAKTNGMEDSFLATLRNAILTEKHFSILMITYSTIDTITSGTGDLSAVGMPFNSGKIIENISRQIDACPLSKAEKCLLKYELKRKQDDRFIDRKSLFEYSIFITILERKKIEDKDYDGFSLLPDHGLANLVKEGDVEKRLNDNHELFDLIDYAYKFNDIESLDSKFDSRLVKELESNKKNKERWQKNLDYERLIESKQRKEKKIKNSLKIEDENINISSVEDTFIINKSVFIAPDSDTVAGRRKRNILIYNPNNWNEIIVKVACNIGRNQVEWNNSSNSEIKYDDKNNICVMFNPQGCTFVYFDIKDNNNNTKYIFYICTVNLPVAVLENINTLYLVNVKKNLKKPKLVIQGNLSKLILNQGRSSSPGHFNVQEGKVYSCDGQKELQFIFDEESNIDIDHLDFNVRIDSVEIPFRINSMKKKVGELSGAKLFKLKFKESESLKYSPQNGIFCGTTPYRIKEQMKIRLQYEYKLVKNGWLAAKLNNEKLSEYEIPVNKELYDAYNDLIQLMKRNNQIPSTISYHNKEYVKLANKYIDEVNKYFESITDKKPLTKDENKMALLGCIIDQDNKKILMSPLQPLNVYYQILLANEKDVENVRDDLVGRLSPRYLLPYIYGRGNTSDQLLYQAVEDDSAPEWRSYAITSNDHYYGSKQFVKKLVCEKIEEYKKHFNFIFDVMNNHVFCINLINMGDCIEVFKGIIQYYIKEIKSNIFEYTEFRINIYGLQSDDNQFLILRNSKLLREFLRFNGYDNLSGKNQNKEEILSELEKILVSHISCFFKKTAEPTYAYAHLTFYEMAIQSETGGIQTDDIATGIALDGLISGVPSVLLNKEHYMTGFGTKYAEENKLIDLAKKYNALFCVAFSINSYEIGKGIVTTVPQVKKSDLKNILDSSNWVVFVDPKVDLSYFNNYSNDEGLMIIHYSDQLSSSSSYDDITVTNKSKQYEAIIQEQLSKKGISAQQEDIHTIINLFNAINGSWLLHLITAKKLSGAADSNFSREKISILSAIKLSLVFYSCSDIIWIPLSLEELLRVSNGTGLSSSSGILSAKNLNFEHGPTCDDILLIGINVSSQKLKVYIHPIEVKIGENRENYIKKAIEQVKHTHDGLINAIWPSEEKNRDKLSCKMIRNFIIQLAIVSAEKMKLYNIASSINWDYILEKHRKELLNDSFDISNDLDSIMGVGTVISFKTDVSLKSVKEFDEIELLELPEQIGLKYIVKNMMEIKKDLINDKDISEMLFSNRYSKFVNGRDSKRESNPKLLVDKISDEEQYIDQNDSGEIDKDNNNFDIVADENNNHDYLPLKATIESRNLEKTPEPNQIKIEFGTEIQTGEKIIWTPNNTDVLFHMNTGIIGTMGTGKTQFTKSLITQIYRNQKFNVGEGKIGILIFDYKGDYNQTKNDFVNAVNPRIYSTYHLPFNPLVLIQGCIKKKLLPMHTANSFKDTLSKVYNLGPKQQKTLIDCIMMAYQKAGISSENENTWANPAPTFEDVYHIYDSDESIKKTDKLAVVMSKLHNFQIFESSTKNTLSLYELLEGVVVIDLSGSDPDIQSLVVAIILDLFYSQMRAYGSSMLSGDLRQLTKLILVDEADNFMSQDFPSLKKILKEGREFGVGMILSTQFLDHFTSGDDDYSKYILTWVVHKVPDLKASDVDFVFNTKPKSDEEQQLFNDIKSLNKHKSIVNIGGETPIYIEDLPFWKLVSNT
jgi:DNA phosphorothioation-dependent restriction protein DptH